MKRLALLALLPVLTVLASIAPGQDTPAPEAPVAPPPLAGLVVHGELELPGAEPDRFHPALAGLDEFESLNDGTSIAAVVRVMLEACSAPGTTVALLGIEDGAPVVAVATPGSLGENDGREGNVSWWVGEGLTYLLYQRGDANADDAMARDANERLRTAFAEHRENPGNGLELMLDLENLRRAWAASLQDGPARRVVALTGLANARKIHVHVPESGPVRLAYSSRALPADEVTERVGPQPVAESAIGVRWPAMFDAGLRTYALALGDEDRQAFGTRFQTWMGQHGNRLRGILQAVEVGMDWSVSQAEDQGLRIQVGLPVRRGVDTARLIDAVTATLRGSGFQADGKSGTLALPEGVAAALGGKSLAFEVDDSAEPAVMRITIE